MSEHARTAASPAGTLRLEDMNDRQILDMIGRAAKDPFVAKEVLHLQKQAYEAMAASVQHMLAKLNGIVPAQGKTAAGPISVLALAGAARQRETAGRKKREFAESLVIGALINRNNPDWDIFDTVATPQDDNNGLLALIKMKPPAPENASA